MHSRSDGELVKTARAGNRDAYGELIRRYQHQICGLACVLIGDAFEAEDIAQEAFLRAWINLDLLSDPAKFAPWLRRIVFGVSVDWLRVFRPDLYRLSDLKAEQELSQQPSGGESALERLESIELRRRVWDAVAALPPRYRLPLTLFHLDGLSHAKVAEALHAPVSSVRSLVTRARQKLQPMLAGYAGDILPAVEDVFKEQEARRAGMLHVVDGQSVAGTLREAGPPGKVAIYGDLMYEGPAPAGPDDDAWWETRAQFRASNGFAPLEETRAHMQACRATLEDFARHDEVVLWIDYRLSDQLILIRILDWFSRHNPGNVKLSLISAGRYPGMDRFIGLGQLTADQLTSLTDTRQTVTGEQIHLGQAAWSAFTSPDPTEIERLLAENTAALPFLAGALRRHLEQFPSVDSGLSRTEHQALGLLREHGSLLALRLFFAVQRQEEQVFMGEGSFYWMMNGLASARTPLIVLSEPPQESDPKPTIAITDAGRSVIEGRADHVQLNGIDRWLGGVHLEGEHAAWRWDRVSERLVRDSQ